MAGRKKELNKELLLQKLLPALQDGAPAAALPASPAVPRDDSAFSALHSKLFARTEGGHNQETVAAINVMETLILRHMDAVIQRFNACSCDRCRCDVAACALNRLPPKYVIATPARLVQAEREIPLNTVMDALIKAVIAVRANPRH